jgi:hypothetical protein
MRRLVSTLLLSAFALAAGVAGGCTQEPLAAGDECQQARAVFTKCGVTVPLLSDGACTGVARMVARCVAHHATTCDELSSLVGRIDACAADELDGGDLTPVGDLPVPRPTDAGTESDVSLPPIPPPAATDAGPTPYADASRDAVAHD